MGKYVMAIDQGTTGTTILLIDDKGQVCGQGYKEFRQIYPKPGWVEHDAEEIWQITRETIEKTLQEKQIEAKDIDSIGITNQRETTVVWDKNTGKPIYNAIVWQCRRTSPVCDQLKDQGHEQTIKNKTGLVIDAYFSGTKIAWLLDHVEGAREKAARGELAFGNIDTWLLYKLTEGRCHATDYTNASRTMVYNIHDKKWDEELLTLLNVPMSLLPKVLPSSGIFGKCELFGASIPIAGIAGDQQAALYGQGCWNPGQGKNTYGTGCFLLLNTGDKAPLSTQGLLTTLACDAQGKPVYALEGSVFIAGAAVQWLRDELKIIDNAAQTEEIAKTIEHTGGVYVVPAFAGLGAPYWDSNARAAILGMTRGSGRTQIVRATLEAIAYQTRDVIDVMNNESDVNLSVLKVDGGAAQNDFLMQFQADLLAIPIDRPKVTESTAMGAAFLAGLATGFWQTHHQLADVRVCQKVFEPNMEFEQREKLYSGWKQSVARVQK